MSSGGGLFQRPGELARWRELSRRSKKTVGFCVNFKQKNGEFMGFTLWYTYKKLLKMVIYSGFSH